MKFCSLLLAAIIYSLSLIAQQPASSGKGRITGRILDSLSQNPVEYATITLYASNNKVKPINGTTTNNKGVFTLEGLTPGSYTLTIGFIGYQSHSTGVITLGGRTMNITLGDISLFQKEEAMQAVTVTAPKGLVENKIDKMVYNAEKDITSQGGVATDVLKKVPMVSVDVDANLPAFLETTWQMRFSPSRPARSRTSRSSPLPARNTMRKAQGGSSILF